MIARLRASRPSTTEAEALVRYETVEERRAAMIAKGWSPAVLAAMEEAMEPKFLRDMREENEKAVVVKDGGESEIEQVAALQPAARAMH